MNWEHQKRARQAHKHLGEKDAEEFPEGGWGWMVILGGFFVLNTTYGMIIAFGVYQVYYMATFPDVKPSTIIPSKHKEKVIVSSSSSTTRLL